MNKSKSSCSCEVCKSACLYKPGWFMPGEADTLASALGMDLIELFKTKLGVDWYSLDEDDVFLLAPATIEMEAGEEYPGDPQAQCIFYDAPHGHCTIHGKGKPFECQEFWHGEENQSEILNPRHKSVALAWRDHQDSIKSLLGRDPIPEEYSGPGLGLGFGLW